MVEAKELIIKTETKEIYGKVCMPEGEGVHPIIILSHGYNGCHEDFAKECLYYANNGYIAYAFDFSGGSTRSKSKGLSTEMTIFTEKEDLKTVFNYFKEQDYVDKDRMYLFGGSQGGLVTSLATDELRDEVRGMALYYPALNIPDDWRKNYKTDEEIPETIEFWGLTLGRVFFASMREFNTYDNIGKFDKEILIVHGDEDNIVLMSAVEKAKDIYSKVNLEILPGEGHGFTPEGGEKAMKLVLEYLNTH